MLLKDKVAIITGAAVGMGKGMALKFAQEGCTVAVADINMEGANQTVAEMKQNGIAIQCDVTNMQQVKAAVDQVVSKFGRVDILVNNAGGIFGTPPIEDMTEADWDKTLSLNLKSDFFFCKFVVPHMKQKKYGKIINLSSIGAVFPPAHAISYNTAKSGVIGFTMDLANALASLRINVNAILPGPIRTEFYSAHTKQMTEQERDAFFAFLGTKVPMQRVGTPEDVAGAALFLASEMSSWITGQILYVAGGLPLQPSVPHK